MKTLRPLLCSNTTAANNNSTLGQNIPPAPYMATWHPHGASLSTNFEENVKISPGPVEEGKTANISQETGGQVVRVPNLYFGSIQYSWGT